MLGEEFVQKFGYCEMYEWAQIPKSKHGLFVQFDDNNHTKIVPYHGGHLVGVSSVCAVTISDDPTEWQGKYLVNEVGDFYVNKETIAVGEKVYDHVKELAYIATKPADRYVKIESENYVKEAPYILRSSRDSWAAVNLLGKCIVRDNGECTPGKYCAPYTGADESQYGIAVPAKGNIKNKFFVMGRLTPNTILILNR